MYSYYNYLPPGKLEILYGSSVATEDPDTIVPFTPPDNTIYVVYGGSMWHDDWDDKRLLWKLSLGTGYKTIYDLSQISADQLVSLQFGNQAVSLGGLVIPGKNIILRPNDVLAAFGDSLNIDQILFATLVVQSIEVNNER